MKMQRRNIHKAMGALSAVGLSPGMSGVAY